MWDKRKGKPRYDQKGNNSWLGPYMIKKKYDKEMYYLTTLHKRKMPLFSNLTSRSHDFFGPFPR